jgi:hypothetical protein
MNLSDLGAADFIHKVGFETKRVLKLCHPQTPS